MKLIQSIADSVIDGGSDDAKNSGGQARSENPRTDVMIVAIIVKNIVSGSN